MNHAFVMVTYFLAVFVIFTSPQEYDVFSILLVNHVTQAATNAVTQGLII